MQGIRSTEEEKATLIKPSCRLETPLLNQNDQEELSTFCYEICIPEDGQQIAWYDGHSLVVEEVDKLKNVTTNKKRFNFERSQTRTIKPTIQYEMSETNQKQPEKINEEIFEVSYRNNDFCLVRENNGILAPDPLRNEQNLIFVSKHFATEYEGKPIENYQAALISKLSHHNKLFIEKKGHPETSRELYEQLKEWNKPSKDSKMIVREEIKSSEMVSPNKLVKIREYWDTLKNGRFVSRCVLV
jgi:hypothetical protein